MRPIDSSLTRFPLPLPQVSSSQYPVAEPSCPFSKHPTAKNTLINGPRACRLHGLIPDLVNPPLSAAAQAHAYPLTGTEPGCSPLPWPWLYPFFPVPPDSSARSRLALYLPVTLHCRKRPVFLREMVRRGARPYQRLLVHGMARFKFQRPYLTHTGGQTLAIVRNLVSEI